MPNINNFKTLINMCFIFLLLISLVSFSFTSVNRYTYVLPSTGNQLNIYIIQKYNTSPIEINVTFNLNYSPYIYIYIHNDSLLNISFRSSPVIFTPIITYNSSSEITLIEINYLYANNMTILIYSSQNQYIKIIGNVSFVNTTYANSDFISTTKSFSKYNLNYITFILILLISIIIFIALKRYKGY